MQMKHTLAVFIATILLGCFTISGTSAAPDTRSISSVTGSERKAILDAVRQEIKRLHGLEMVFVVRHLEVRNGWAWFHALPQSRDGKSHYDDIAALLHKNEGRWQIMEMPCTEEDNPDCLGDPEFFSQLRRRFKDIPPAILPD